jgi:hypothetical protein
MDDAPWTVHDHIRYVCLKIGEAKERLRSVGYMERVNKEYTDTKRQELDAIQRDLENQL